MGNLDFLELGKVEKVSSLGDSVAFDNLPADQYYCEVVKAELGQSKAGNTMIKLQYKVQDGEYSGRFIFDNIVVQGAEKAVRFGKVKLKLIAECMGVPELNDVEDLMGKFLEVKVDEDEYNGKPTNKILDYYSAGEKPAGSMDVASGETSLEEDSCPF